MSHDDIALDRAMVRDHGFPAFAALAWSYADSSDLVWSDHMGVICDELEVMSQKRARGIGSNLGIAIPPGSSKSMLVSVLWQPYVWTWWPESAWITAAYDDGLAYHLSGKARNLVQSEWFQKRWPMQLVRTGNNYWSNSRGGYRISVGIGSRITGEHGHFIVGDDLIKEQLSRIGNPSQIADAVRKGSDFWFSTLSTRAIDYIAGRVLVHQRLHISDPIGVAEKEHGYDVLKYAARFDPDNADHRDHRKAKGELLCPRMTDQVIAAIEREIGPRAAKAQLDQNPEAAGGAIIQAEYLARRWDQLPAEIRRDMETGTAGFGRTWISASDLAFKGKPTSDFHVIQIWCAYQGDRYLVAERRGRWGFRESKEQLRQVDRDYSMIEEHLLEDAANAAATEDDLRDAVPGIVLAPVAGGCLARTQAVEGEWAAKIVVIPANEEWVDGKDGFVEEHLRYNGDGTSHDDRVSASSLALLRLKGSDGLPSWASGAETAMKEIRR